MQKSDSISNLVKALAAAQDKFDPILKDKDNPFFHSKYADLAAVIAATQPSLAENGLVVSQFPVSTETRVGVFTILMHTSGEFIGESYTLPMVKQDAQTGVAAVTYARRAAYSGAIGVAAEDDDGNTAAGRDDIPQEQTPRKRGRPAFVKEEKTVVTYKQTTEENSGNNEPISIPLAEPTLGINIPDAIPATDAVLPTEAKLQECRMFIQNLKGELEQAGLKPSRNLPTARKILLYLLDVTGTDAANKITVTQWDTLVGFVNKIRLLEGGLDKLVKLVDAAAKKHSSVATATAQGE